VLAFSIYAIWLRFEPDLFISARLSFSASMILRGRPQIGGKGAVFKGRLATRPGQRRVQHHRETDGRRGQSDTLCLLHDERFLGGRTVDRDARGGLSFLSGRVQRPKVLVRGIKRGTK
jgi:hypothetical protein